MKSKVVVMIVGALVLVSCAAISATVYPSPGSLVPSTTVASQGSVFFVSPTEAWELTQPPDRLRTVVLRTLDGGAHWKLWGIAPEAGSPVGFSATEVVLSAGTDLLRSTDGSNWTTRTMPVSFGSPTFLPDLQHGWVGGFPIYVPPVAAPPTLPPGKGGGGGGASSTGKGGGPAASPASSCNGKGCAPIDLYSTADGGATWHVLLHSTASVDGGAMYFFSATTGIIEQGSSILVTRDGGFTWRPQALSIPGVTTDQPASDQAPTMFDARNGVLPVQTSNNEMYLSETSDGGLTWSAARRVNDCASCTGGLVFLDSKHWIDYSQGVHLTADGGQTWTKVTTTNPGKIASGVQVVNGPSPAVFVFAPGIFASETTDWGAHWRAIALPDLYPTYSGFAGQGGWGGV